MPSFLRFETNFLSHDNTHLVASVRTEDIIFVLIKETGGGSLIVTRNSAPLFMFKTPEVLSAWAVKYLYDSGMKREGDVLVRTEAVLGFRESRGRGGELYLQSSIPGERHQVGLSADTLANVAVILDRE